MSNSLANMKLHYKTLFDKDTPFVIQYGTEEEKAQWDRGGDIIIKTMDTKFLKQTALRMGEIRENIHKRNEHDTRYRLLYLQKGPETLQDIEKKLGSDIANVVKNLRNNDK